MSFVPFCVRFLREFRRFLDFYDYNFDDFYVMLNPDFKKLAGFELSSPRALRRYSQLLSTLRSLHDRASYVRRLDGLAETGSDAEL